MKKRERNVTRLFVFFPSTCLAFILTFLFVLPESRRYVCVAGVVLMTVSLIILIFSLLFKFFKLSSAREAGVIALLVYSLIPLGADFTKTSAFVVYVVFVSLSGFLINLAAVLEYGQDEIRRIMND